MTFATEKCFLNYQKAFVLNIYCLLTHSKCYGPEGRKKQGTWCGSDIMSRKKKPISASVQEQDEKSSRIKQQSAIKSRKIKRKTGVYTFTLNSCWQFLFSYHVAPCQASANPELILLSRAVAVKGTLTANLHGSHRAVTDKKLSMRIPVEIIYISLFYFLLPLLYFPWNACQCGFRGSALFSQGTIPLRHPALTVPSGVLPHAAKLSPRSFST